MKKGLEKTMKKCSYLDNNPVIFSLTRSLHTSKKNIQDFRRLLTGVHPCKCKSQSLPAPDTHLTNTDSRTPCHTYMTWWVGRGGVGIRCFSNIHLLLTRPSVYKKSKQYVFEKNMAMFTPNSDQFRGI